LEAGKKIPLLDIGAGVYPTTILFNHSCTPNTLRINQGTRVSKKDNEGLTTTRSFCSVFTKNRA
jgi:hypothetical protein